MTDAPERIWAGPRGATYSTEAEQRTTEYIRARWSSDMDAAPKDGTLHLRGLWVYSVETGKPLYWQADVGSYNNGEFIGSSGDDFGWSADDYTHWIPIPAPPKGET